VPLASGHAGRGGPEAFTHCQCRPWPVRSAVLSHYLLAGVGCCPLANGHGLSAGLLVGVPDRLPVSHCRSNRACSGAGPALIVGGWIASSSVRGGLGAGVPDPITVHRLLGRGAVCAGSPVSRCRDGLWIHRAGRSQPAKRTKDSDELALSLASRQLRAACLSSWGLVRLKLAAFLAAACEPVQPVYGSYPIAVEDAGGAKLSATRLTRTPLALPEATADSDAGSGELSQGQSGHVHSHCPGLARVT
jgi:hypothetical protein